MNEAAIMSYIAVPALIFVARVADVTIGTMRIVFLSKGFKYIAPVLGFFEILIWLVAVSKIFQNLDMWFYYVAYAGGFATGNLVGLIIEEKLALGFVALRIITHKPGAPLIKKLIASGYGVTTLEAQSSQGKVNVIFCIIKRSQTKKVAEIIQTVQSDAFYTLEDVRRAHQGVFPIRDQNKPTQSFWRPGK